MQFTEPDEERTTTETGAEEQQAPVILIVDDEEEVRTVLRLILTMSGYEVREAESGQTAIERIPDLMPDLILLDVMMPGVSGFDVCRAVRADPQTADIPILILSARSDPRSREEGLEAGATMYLTKPQVPAQLLAHIADTLGRPAKQP